MGRHCSSCGDWQQRGDYSANQWRKGEGSSRCYTCVDGGGGFRYECHQCGRSFNNQNELNMHMQVHRPRSVACPVCGEQRFRSGANAVQHLESGYCSGCRGQENARDQIYRFASSQQAMRPYLTNAPMLTYGDSSDYGRTPDFPYHCNLCQKSFRQMSQLLQHNDQKHGQHRMIGY